MTSNEAHSSDSTNESLDQIVADYVRAVEAGEPPCRDDLLAQHPDLAGELREFFGHRDRMEALLDPLRRAAARVLNVRCPHCHNTIELLDRAQLTELNCPSCGSNFSLIAKGSAGHFPNGMKRIGQFQLIDRVGIGQFGSVWKARDLALERTVAIKIPRDSGLSEAETEMFLRDARLASQLNHPNIVGVHEVGKQDNTIYIVSDFIPGATLKEWMSAKRLTHREVAELCVIVAKALHHAHAAGVVHRDLKPGNIMMDLDGEPHIVDFGLAKRDSGEITMTVDGQILGTPAYMSPEQARGEGHDVDGRADVYSLGVILFELLTGELPFRGEKQMLIVQILNDDPPAPRRLDNTVPRDLETICLKCLRKEPTKRYPTAAALADDLQRWLDRQPIVARPVRRLEKAWLWCRRHPEISSLLALLAVVIVAAVLISREVQHRERADGLVNQLMAVDTADLPDAILQLAPYRDRVRPRLESKSTSDAREPDADRHLRASLARFLLYDDDSDLSVFYERMLAAEPGEFAVLCDALSKRRGEFIERLWTLAESPRSDPDRRFRACCALAAYDPDNKRWQEVSAFVADQLASSPLASTSRWRARLVPVHQRLIEPLEAILKDEDAWTPKRNLAADSLASFLGAEPEELLRLLMESGEQQFTEFFPALAAHRASFVRLLRAELEKHPNEARRRAFAAIAAYQLELPEMATPVLRQDPEARTCFVHWAAALGLDPHAIIAHIEQQTDDTIRRALVLSLREFTFSKLSADERDWLSSDFFALYRDDPDAGMHAALEWLLNEWGYGEQLSEIRRSLEVNEPLRLQRDSTSPKQWYVNTQGHTMAIVDAGEFLMGAPFDPVVSARVPQHRVRIGRTFAIASKEVTREQMKPFLAALDQPNERHGPNEFSPRADSPQNMMTWYEAAAYCSWLNEKEGIPSDQWCYLPNADGDYAEGMQVASDFLARTGYRLPTEAEWEFAARAGTATLSHFGDGQVFLSRYACFAQSDTERVGSFKPNDFGLFDMLGNVAEWCHDYRDYPSETSGTVFVDVHAGGAVTRTSRVVARGGSFNGLRHRTHSVDRSLAYPPNAATRSSGFRVARTIIPAPQDLWGKAEELARQGRWREAAELIELTLPHLVENADDWQRLLSAWLFLGEHEKANAICDEMLRRFGDTEDPAVAHQLASLCLAIPNREPTGEIQQLAELAATVDNPTHYRDMGILCYRQGRFAEAEQWLLKGKNVYLRGRPATLYFLAMARHRRGDASGALEALREAQRSRDRVGQQFSDGEFGDTWPVWLVTEAIRREAEVVIGVETE